MLISRFHSKFPFISFFIIYLKCCDSSVLKRNDFGGEFSGTSVSGSDAPGPTANTMGDKAASAMAIGTGTAGAGDYTSNYKTPNYTQYTSQDFKEYMPNYQDMMESSMDKMSGMGGGTSSMGFGNFTAVGSMLKAFMDLQKEQLAVEKAKTDANKAKVDLAINYDDESDESETEEEVEYRANSHRRRKRSLMTLLSPGNSIIPNPFGGPSVAKQPMSRPMIRPPMPGTPMTQPLLRPSPIINKKDESKKMDTSLTDEEKATLKKIMGLLEVPQVKGLLNTLSSLTSESGKSTKMKRQFRQAAPPPSTSGSSLPPPPPPPSQSPSTSPPPQSSQSTQQSDNDWKKYLSSPTSNSPTASGSGGDWSKYMDSSSTGGSWGGQTKRDTSSWASDDSKSKDWSNGGWSSSSPSSSGSWSPDSSSSSGQSWSSSTPSSGSPSPQPPPPQGSFDWSKGNGGGSTGSKDWSSGSSQRRVRSSFADPSMSPVHGSMSLMNLPMYSSPTPNNIPNLSFSLNPTSPEAEGADEVAIDDSEEKSIDDKSPLIFALPQQPPSLVLQSPPSSSYSPSPMMTFMQPPTYSLQSSGPLMAASQPLMSSSSPFIYSQSPVLQQPVSDPFLSRELSLSDTGIEPLRASSSLPVLYNGPKPMFYNAPSPKFYNSPKMLGPSREIYETAPSSQPLLMTSDPKPLQLYRLGRSEPILDDKSPISVYKVSKNDATGLDEIKKIIIDIDKGIIVSQSDRSEEELTEIPNKKHLTKRSIFESDEDFEEDMMDETKELENFPFVRVPFFKGTEKLLKLNHHFEDKPDRQRRPTTTTTSESSDSAPAPPPEASSTESSSTVNDTTITSSKESRYSSTGYQYQASGTDTDYDYAETPQIDEGPEEQDESRKVKREVKIGFEQKGDLPPGSSETVSAGGGKSPGHHEGGGLTVKVKDDDDPEEEEDSLEEDEKKGDPRSFNFKKSSSSPKRKTLNFYFTW